MSATEVANGFSISGLLDASAQTANRFPVKEIPLDDISEHPGNVAYSMDEEGIARLAESIERDGLTDLPLVRRLQGGGFQMISGHRRMAAFRLLAQQGPSYSKLPCRVIADISDEQALVLLHTANFFTRALTVTERAAATKALGIQVVDLPQLNAMVGENVAHRPGGAVSLAVGMAFIFSNIPGLDHLMNYWYHFCIMFEALFIMTIIDAGTRVGRYMLQELVGHVWPKFGDPNWKPGAILASALICAAWGYLVLNGNLSTIWPIFGVSNQLLAIIALSISSVVICSMGKARYLWVTGLPWIFLVVMIFWADFLNIFEIYLPKGEWTMFTVSIIMAVLVIIVAIGAIRRCIYLAKTVPASYDTTETVEAEELKHLQELVKTDKAAQRFQELTIAHH